jgi:hypothetical protein
VEQPDFITTEKQCIKCKKKKSAIFKVLEIMGETANFVPTNSRKIKHFTDCHHYFTHIPSYISNFSPLHLLLLLGHQFPQIHSQTPSHLACISSKLNCAARSSIMKIKAAGFSQTLVMST